MNADTSLASGPANRYWQRMSPLTCLGIALGVLLPALSAALFPTYMHRMPIPVWEWARLQELPFVALEFAIVVWAIVKGMEFRQIWSNLSRDTRFALGLFVIGLWSSTLLVSRVPLTSIVISATMVIHLLFACSVYFLVGRNREDTLDSFPRWCGVGLAMLAFLTAWRFALPPPPSDVFGGKIEWHAAVPGFISVRHFGSWTGAITAMFAALIMARKEQDRLEWVDWFFLLAMGLTIWSGTRAAILAIGVAGLIQLISSRKLPSLHTLGRLSILTGSSAIIAYLLIPYNQPEFMLIGSASEFSSISAAGTGRVELWTQTLQRWLEAPMFGWGSGSTFWEVFAGWRHTQPHNFLFQFLISWGIVGTIGAVWLLGRAVVAAHSVVSRSQPELWPLLTCTYALLAMACLEGMLHYPRFVMLIVALLAIILKLCSKLDQPVSD
jgi:exopolysaccharide production protein ExoQ